MLSATQPSKGSRRSTRKGRSLGGAGRSSRGGVGEASWRPSDKAARKWIEVMRPPAPGARFFIPTWVPVDELTPEEQTKYENQEEETTTAQSDGVGDTEMTATGGTNEEEEKSELPSSSETVKESLAAVVTECVSAEMKTKTIEKEDVALNPEDHLQKDSTKEYASITVSHRDETEMVTEVEASIEVAIDAKPVEIAKSIEASTCTAVASPTSTETTHPAAASDPFELLVNTASNAEAANVIANADVEMPDADTEKDTQPTIFWGSAEIAPEIDAQESASDSKAAILSPLNMSRETSEGVPESHIDSKASESVEAFEGERPHNPVADTLEDPATVPPSRPVSEPAAMLLEGSAALLFGESVMHPVPVAGPARDSQTKPPATASKDSVLFVHSLSDTAPFHAPTAKASKDEDESIESPSTGTPDASDELVSEPQTKRPRLAE